MTGIRLLLYIFLIVISNPYDSIDYNKINVYNVNYCTGYYCPDLGSDSDHYDDYFKEEEIESYEYEDEDEIKKPLIFNLDFNNED